MCDSEAANLFDAAKERQIFPVAEESALIEHGLQE